jgi:alpha-tubulin suppressor-like RCC1 family protein
MKVCCVASGMCYSVGYNKNGQLGIGTNVTTSTFKRITSTIGNQKIIEIACGYDHTLFLNCE